MLYLPKGGKASKAELGFSIICSVQHRNKREYEIKVMP